MSWAATVVGGAIAVGGEVYHAAHAKHQQNLLKKKESQIKYEIPHTISNKLSNATLLAIEGLPDEQKQEFITNVQRSQNFGLKGLESRSAGIQGLSSVVQQGDDAYNKLLAQDAAARIGNIKYLGDVQSEEAGYKDKQFDINTYRPYVRDYNQALAEYNAGMKNISTSGEKLGETVLAAKLGSKTDTTGKLKPPSTAYNDTSPDSIGIDAPVSYPSEIPDYNNLA